MSGLAPNIACCSATSDPYPTSPTFQETLSAWEFPVLMSDLAPSVHPCMRIALRPGGVWNAASGGACPSACDLECLECREFALPGLLRSRKGSQLEGEEVVRARTGVGSLGEPSAAWLLWREELWDEALGSSLETLLSPSPCSWDLHHHFALTPLRLFPSFSGAPHRGIKVPFLQAVCPLPLSAPPCDWPAGACLFPSSAPVGH